jgi:hypothetical protein
MPSQCRKGDTPNGLGVRSGKPLPAGRLLSGTEPADRFAFLDHAVLLAENYGVDEAEPLWAPKPLKPVCDNTTGARQRHAA